MMSEHTGRSYEAIAAKYADTIDEKPFTVLYERPAFISLLPMLEKIDVLDAGCGSGWYSEFLLKEGAQITAFDLNKEFVHRTRERTGNTSRVILADLSKPLRFAKDGEFDLVICPLVMHYLKEWQPTFHEFYRVLKPEGILVFSTHHPFMDWQQFKTEDYFAVDLLEDEWDIGKVTFYRRPITLISQDLEASGFLIERILEPQPLETLADADSELFERLMKNPWRLMIRARKT